MSRLLVAAAAFASAAWGAAAAVYYDAVGLSLSHYDAKAHLVVARRIFDSLTPGWEQVGAVWLPLPHLLNALPVQVDAFYRTGASATALSVAAFAAAVGALTWIVARATGSAGAAVVAALVIGTDPNVLYLQATPMTEPLLIGLMLVGLALAYHWVDEGCVASARWPALALAAACLTRYEAWPFTVALLALVGIVLLVRGRSWSEAVRSVGRLAVGPAMAVLAFFVLSRVTVGEWFVADGFYEPDQRTLGHVRVAAGAVTWGTRQLAGNLTYVAAVLGLTATAVAVVRRRLRPEALLVVALLACGLLPFYAFVSGHPFRVRYMVPLLAAVAACVGLGVGLVPQRIRGLAAAAVAALVLVETPPFSAQAPMLLEAQWDRPRSEERRVVTRCLAGQFQHGHDLALASMGSLAHYMQELSGVGFQIRDFLHEGNGERWHDALRAPAEHVQWILFEEQAEDGDLLTRMRRTDAAFTAGFGRVCEGGGVTLYRRR